MAIKISDKEIYETTDYDLFRQLLGNRDPKQEKAIVDSINKVGYIFDPILCNENFEIIDGQNRLEALRKLGMPVYFTIERGIGIEECRQMNIGRTNWGMEDYIYSYAEIGNPDYRRIQSLLNEFKKVFTVEGVFLFVNCEKITDSGNMTSTIRKKIKEGKFILSQEDYDWARARMKNAHYIGYCDFFKQNNFRSKVYWGAVAYIYLHRQAEAKSVLAKLRTCTLDIPACNTISEQLRYFDEACNKGKRAENKIFLSTDFQQRKYMEKER